MPASTWRSRDTANRGWSARGKDFCIRFGGKRVSFCSLQVFDTDAATLEIKTDHESKGIQELGEDESYTLDVTSIGAKLHAANPLGVLRGLQTLLQLIAISPDGFSVPAVHIEDRPRFPWRGLMIDSGRHFIPLDVIKRNLDGMEAVKMNVFHWHLSDNQGFRAESRKFPKLHEQGSDGLYYTQDEIRDVIEYARDRGIRVVPEFDMPGHSTAWFVGHPELASGSGPYAVERKWGVFDPAMDPTDEKTYKFLNEFIGEMARLFPDQFFHIGGDEVNGKEWDANPKIQAFKKSHKIKDNAGLQAYFSGRVQDLVAKHKKTPVGWDEVLVPGVPKTIVIQSWRGVDALAAAAKDGYRGHSFERLLPGPGLERRAALRDGSAGRAGGGADAGAEATYSWRRIVHLVRVCERGEHRFAHLAAQRRDCRAAVVAGRNNGRCFDVLADGDGVRAT